MSIVRHKRGEVPSKMTEADWARLKAMTLEQVERNALDDAENPPLTADEIARGRMALEIRRLRQSMSLSQDEFARKFGVNLARLRDWEQGRHMPDSFAQSFLRVIAKNPKAVEEALA